MKRALLECPVCMDVPAGHVLQCDAGHLVCATCHAQLACDACPTCRTPFGGRRVRCRIAEQLIETLPTTCEWCNTAMTMGELAEHKCTARTRRLLALTYERARVYYRGGAGREVPERTFDFGNGEGRGALREVQYANLMASFTGDPGREQLLRVVHADGQVDLYEEGVAFARRFMEGHPCHGEMHALRADGTCNRVTWQSGHPAHGQVWTALPDGNALVTFTTPGRRGEYIYVSDMTPTRLEFWWPHKRAGEAYTYAEGKWNWNARVPVSI
mgnify:CR=1 FL=1